MSIFRRCRPNPTPSRVAACADEVIDGEPGFAAGRRASAFVRFREYVQTAATSSVVLPSWGEIGSLFGRFNSLFGRLGNLPGDLRYSNDLPAAKRRSKRF
jgi:hypothetical protein